MITVVGGIKGGTGKSTIAVNLAILEATRGQDTVLVDADTQDTASDFVAYRDRCPGIEHKFQAYKMQGASLVKEISKLITRYQSIIVDAGGGDTTSQRAALAVAHLMIVPFVPSAFDVWTIEKLSDLVRSARKVNPDLKAYSILNRADASGEDNDSAIDVLRSYSEIEYLDLTIGTRKAFRRATMQGKGIMEYANATPKARGEMSLLHQTLFLEAAHGSV